MNALRVCAPLATTVIAPPQLAQDGTIAFRVLTPEIALTAAQAAIHAICDRTDF